MNARNYLILRIALLLLLVVAAGTAYALPPPPPAAPTDVASLPTLATLPANTTQPPNTTANTTNTTANATNSTNTTTVPANTTTVTGVVVTLLYPGVNSSEDLNVTYKHNATGNANCTVAIDGSVKRTHNGVRPNEWWVDTSFTPFRISNYLFTVSCTNGTWSGSASKSVSVLDEEDLETLDITPRRVYAGQQVMIEGVTEPQRLVVLIVTNPALGNSSFNTTSDLDGEFEARYTLPQTSRNGTYTVTAYPGNSVALALRGTFRVIQRVPSVYVSGNRNISEGSTFTVMGEQFLERDNITLSLIGGGATVKNTTIANAQGEFSFTYPGTLGARQYTLLAQSENDTNVKATTNFTIIAKPAAAVPNVTPPVITAQNPRFDDPVEETQETVQTPVTTTPYEESPAAIPQTPLPDYAEDYPAEEVEEGSSMWRWILIPLLLVLIIGGTGAFLVHNGTLDISSTDAFMSSLQNMFGGSAPHNAKDDVFARLQGQQSFGSQMDPSEQQTIMSFIHGERSKGFDDLTIRSALLAKGWDKHEVDRVFDEVYRGQQ